MSLTIVNPAGKPSEVSNPGIKVTEDHFVKLEFLYGTETSPYNPAKRTIHIHPGRVYAVRYYDTPHQKVITARGIVKSIAKDYMVLNAIYTDTNKQCDFCPMHQTSHAGLISPENVIISYSTITDVADCQNCIKRGEIVFLGVTAQEVKAIVIKLGILDDEVSTTYVDMKIGGEYNVVYMDGSSICETTGVLIAMERITRDVERDTPACKGVVRLCGDTQDEFLACKDQDLEDMVFTFNVSKSVSRVYSTVFGTEGTHTRVYLSNIRSCKCLREPGVKDTFVVVDGHEYMIVTDGEAVTIRDTGTNVTNTVSYNDIIVGLINKPTPL